jgi:hypothetical protein
MTCYFFVDDDGTENVSNYPPERHPTEGFWVVYKNIDNKKETFFDGITELPKGTFEALFKKKLTWKDNPVKIDWGSEVDM